MEYAISIFNECGFPGHWYACDASSLAAAKREAVRKLGSRMYAGAQLVIAKIDDGKYRPIARRPYDYNGRWGRWSSWTL